MFCFFFLLSVIAVIDLNVDSELYFAGCVLCVGCFRLIQFGGVCELGSLLLVVCGAVNVKMLVALSACIYC